MRKADYDVKYIREHTKRYQLQLNIEKDQDLINYMSQQTNVNQFLKGLVQEKMKKEQ